MARRFEPRTAPSVLLRSTRHGLALGVRRMAELTAGVGATENTQAGRVTCCVRPGTCADKCTKGRGARLLVASVIRSPFLMTLL